MVYWKLKMPILLLVILLMNGLTGNANVSFKFAANSIENDTLKVLMENNISTLLTEINRAGLNGLYLNLSDISMEQAAKERLIALWDNSRFVCDKPTNISKCLHDFMGYQVRAIPITMKPMDSSYSQSYNRELTVSLNRDGMITGVRLSLELNEDINKILAITGAGGVMESRARREILKWIEDLRSYYIERNIKELERIYSIYGFNEEFNRAIYYLDVINEDSIDNKVIYKTNKGLNYINKLCKLFTKRTPIILEFDHISVMKHGAVPNIYGLTLHQKLKADGYYDEGWLFLHWDFNDPDKPQHRFGSWQSDEDVKVSGVNTLDDFFIPFH